MTQRRGSKGGAADWKNRLFPFLFHRNATTDGEPKDAAESPTTRKRRKQKTSVSADVNSSRRNSENSSAESRGSRDSGEFDPSSCKSRRAKDVESQPSERSRRTKANTPRNSEKSRRSSMTDANNNPVTPPAQENTVKSRFMKSVREIETSLRSRKIRRSKSKEPRTPSQPTQSAEGASATAETQRTATQQSAESAESGGATNPHTNLRLSDKFRERRKMSREGVREEKTTRNSIRQSLKSFKERRAKNLAQVKTFISRPYKTASMQKILSKVSRRKEYRDKRDCSDSEDSTTAALRLKKGDDIFPTLKKQQVHSEAKPQIAPSKQVPSPAIPATPGGAAPQRTLAEDIKEKLFKQSPKRQVKLVKNHDNNGQLFNVDGKPFWQQKGKGLKGRNDVDTAEDLTDDELPMNAELLLDVHSGKIKLMEMPNTQITLDPFAPTEQLEGRDEQFFTRNVLFSNTVRSMINLNDEMTNSDRRKTTSSSSSVRETRKTVRWDPEPTKMAVYDRRKPEKIVQKNIVKN